MCVNIVIVTVIVIVIVIVFLNADNTYTQVNTTLRKASNMVMELLYTA